MLVNNIFSLIIWCIDCITTNILYIAVPLSVFIANNNFNSLKAVLYIYYAVSIY